ncbi:MAG: hypothetical protein ACRD08_00190 [Acidimicrobiales bacterium]
MAPTARFDLTESQVKVVLKSLNDRDERLNDNCNISNDEDEIAVAGNDLVELRLVKKTIERTAVAAFGDSVLNLSDEIL